MLTTILTAAASSVDALACGFTIGLNRIRLSGKSVFLISLFPFFIALCGMYAGGFVYSMLSVHAAKLLGGCMYVLLAVTAFASRYWKSDAARFDVNHDQKISGMEIVQVGIALGVDSTVAVLPLALLGMPPLLCAFVFGLCNMLCLLLGNALSRTHSLASYSATYRDKSWLLFLCLGLFRLI